MFWPKANSPKSVDAPSAIKSPRCKTSPALTAGRWLILVDWLERVNLTKL